MEEGTETQNKSKTVGIIALVFVLLFAGGIALALFKGNKSSEVKKEEQAKEAVMEKKEEKTFAVEAVNFAFSPKEIKVKKGESVKVVLTNKGSFPHDFVIDELNVKTKQIKAGETDEVTFVADKSGTFEYYCSVGTHRQQGMIGKLIVE